jgi:hypothetical protein
VGDFRKENRKNMAALEQMINESSRFEEINRLEIRYRDEENPALLYTVVYEGEAVQRALAGTAGEFGERSPDVLEISQELGLNTTRYQEAVEALRELVEANRARQEQRASDQPALNPARITLSVIPATGSYGSTLQVTGTSALLKEQEITLYLDSREWKTVVPDENGDFATTLAIRKIRPGEHLVFARSGLLDSNIVSFEVIPLDTQLYLDFWPGDRWEELFVYAELYAGNIPVTNASVAVLVDGVEALTLETDEYGSVYGSVNLTAGEHSLQLSFDGDGYPLNPSETEIFSITAAPAASLPVTLVAGIGFVGMAALGAVWYLRRRRPVPVPEEPGTEAGTVHIIEPKPPLPGPVDVLIRYQDLFAAGEWGEAAYHLLHSLTARLFLVSDEVLAKTPRELLASLPGSPAAVPFASFVGRYEEVRYGGFPLGVQDPLLTHWNAVLSRIEEAGL